MSNRMMVVFLKELREIFRDGRSRFNLIVSPLIVTPLIILLIGNVVKQQATKSKNEAIAVGIVVGKGAEETRKTIQTGDKIRLEPVTREEAEEKIRTRKLKAALLLPDNADEDLKGMRPIKVRLLIDEGSESSQSAAQRITEQVTQSGQLLTAERLHENGLSMEIAKPFDTVREPIKGGGNVGAVLLATTLPYMLAIYAIMGGISAANDSVAGEKERGTLETLLVSAVSRRDLVLGKFNAIAVSALISSCLSVVGLFVGLNMQNNSQLNFTLKPVAVIAILLVQIPLAVLGSGMLLAISTYARNQKEAQTYLAPVLVAVTVAAMLSMFLKADSGIVFAIVPILNAALVLKASLDGTFNILFITLACITSVLYAGVAVVAAIRMFEQESVLMKA
ncbi:MAG: ABC transporter permease [Capsulimonadales bacterium]|nr:ABC transporter permease [Capsulimonadales bacterium]